MAPVVSAVTNFLLVVFGGTSAAATVAAMVAANAIVYIGGNLLLMKVSQALGPKVPRATSRPPDVEYSDTVAPRRVVYGENNISGMNFIPAIVTGSKGEYLHQVLALVGHEVNAINTVYFNDEALTLDGSGNVTAGSFVGKASVRKYTGTSTQTVDSILNAAITEWDSDHRGRGIAYLALRYTFDQEVYRNGKPDVTCIVQGKKCYDPRLDTSPGANPTNATYAAYTTNPALCLADYLMASYGLSEEGSRVDWASVVTAANICDENVAIPGSTTQKRYTCNLVLEATAEFENNIQALTQAMMGACYYSGGKWRMAAGAWSSSAFSITEDDIVGQVTVQTAQSRKREGYYNAVRGQFVDKDRNYQPVEFEPILNSTYESEDGERIYTEVAFPACNNQYEAQRNAIILSRQSRRQKTVQVVCSLNAYKIRPFETGTVTIAEVGWTNQTVRCIGWKFRPEPAIELTLIEASSTDYSDPSTGTYVTPASVVVSDPATYSPGSPQSFTATQEIESILLSWAAPSNSVPGILYRVFQYTASTPFSSATQIYEGADTQLRVPRTDTATRYFWVQSYYGVTGGTSDPTPSGAGLSSSGKIATLNGYLTNEATLVPADSSGTVSSYADAVGLFKLFSGPTDVTASTTFAIVSEVNCDGDLNTAANTPVSGQPIGYYRVTSLTADSGQFTMSATYGGVTITKVFTVGKAKAGQDGSGTSAVSIILSRTAVQLTAYADGSVPSYADASGQLTVYSGATDVTASATLSASASSGVTGTINTATNTPVSGEPKGYYRITAMSGDVGSLTFTVLYNAVTYTATFSASKNKVGYEIVGSLPTTNLFEGRIVFLTTDDKLYRYTGSAWTAAVSGADITAGTLQTAAFASSIEPVTIVSSVPGTKSTNSIFNTSDGKLYRWNGSAYVATVASTDISGTISDAQIAAVAAAKVTGQLSDSQLAAIAAAKLTGQIVGTQITDGAISTAKIAAGAITSNEIAANTITAADIAAGTITATELSAGSVTTAKIAAGAVTANEIAAATITGAKIAANTITASNIAADTITAGQIAAGAISTDELAANAVTSTKIAVGDFSVQAKNPGFEDGNVGWILEGNWSINYNASIARSGFWYASSTFTSPAAMRNSQLVATNPGEVFYVEAWIKYSSASGLGSYVRLTGLNASGVEVSNQAGNAVAVGNTSYTKSSGTFTVPAGVFSVKVEVVSDITGGTCYVDDVRMIRASNSVLIEDGAVIAAKVAASAITADKISAGAVTAAKISVTNLAAISADLGSITAGTIVLPSGGFIRSGQTAYNTGTGFYIGNDSGTPRFSFGNPSGKNIRWDGLDLTVNGGIILTGSVAANAITASATDLPSDVTLTSANSGVDNTLSTITITATGSTNMLIRCDLTFKFTLASGALINIYKIYRGATLLVDIPITSLASGGTYRVPLQYMDTPSAGSTTYYIKVEPTLGGSTTYIYEDIISVVTEFKR